MAASKPGQASRVVILSSLAHRFGDVAFDDINFEGHYDPMATYAQSKTANLWTAIEIERRFGPQGIHTWSVHPGAVLTDLSRHLSHTQRAELEDDESLAKTFKTPEQGAATSVWAATASALEGQGGMYLENCQISGPWEPASGQWGHGYGRHAYDSDKAALL